MPPLPTIADVYRCTINYGAIDGVTAHNVLHVQLLTGNEATVAASLDANFRTNMIQLLADALKPESFDILKLDGSSAQQNFPYTGTADGQGTGDIIPAAAGVLSLHTAQRGPRGRGRLFIGPTTEGLLSAGLIAGAVTASTVAAWTDFMGDCLDDGVVLGVASYAHSDFHEIVSFSMRTQAGTVRRRQDQLVH